MISTQDVVVTLPEEEAWEFLHGRMFGRLAYHLVGEVHIVPINYAVVDGQVVFRTAPGSKLLGVVMNEDVAFEVDEIGDDRATSVVVRGAARLLRGAAADRAARCPCARGCRPTRTRSWRSTSARSAVVRSGSTAGTDRPDRYGGARTPVPGRPSGAGPQRREPGGRRGRVTAT